MLGPHNFRVKERNMRIAPSLAVAAIILSGGTVASAQTLPAYMAPIAGKTAATPSDTATKDLSLIHI